MQIDIPQAEQANLLRQATAAGYDDVKRYVTDHVLALAQHPTADNQAPLSPEELKASLAMIDRGMAEIKAGKGLSIEQARQRALNRLGR